MSGQLSQVPDLLAGVTSSTATLVDWVLGLGLSDDDTRAPSELPGWSRGHTLSHIARNADRIAAEWLYRRWREVEGCGDRKAFADECNHDVTLEQLPVRSIVKLD